MLSRKGTLVTTSPSPAAAVIVENKHKNLTMTSHDSTNEGLNIEFKMLILWVKMNEGQIVTC